MDDRTKTIKPGSVTASQVDPFDMLLQEMQHIYKERTKDYAQEEDPLRIMKRAARILLKPTWEHGMDMMTQKFSRALQAYENPGTMSNEKFKGVVIDLAVYCLLTTIAYGRPGEAA